MKRKPIIPIKRKSSILTPPQRNALRRYVRKHLTLSEAAENLRVHRVTLARVIKVGRGAPENIEKIKAGLFE